MPPKRTNRLEISKPATAGATEDCVLPDDVLLCIFTLLPVKSIQRFKSVSKPWCKIFSSPVFRKMHHARFPQNPENQSIFICVRRTANLEHTMSLLKIESGEKTKPTKLDIPPPQSYYPAELIGCCNGLICMAFPPHGQLIFLWNPALNMTKCLPIPDLAIGPSGSAVSLGFGYDEEAGDFKVVRVVSSEKMSLGAEVYSADSDSWSTIDVGFQFIVNYVGFQFIVNFTRNDVIVNGNPYWFTAIDKKQVLVCFVVREMVFKIVPLPDLNNEDVDCFKFVDWKGNLGALVCKKKNEGRVSSLNVWVFYDSRKLWSKNCCFELKVERFLPCLKNGKILVGECLGEDVKVFLFDTENGGVKEIVIDGAKNGSFQFYGYTESLAYIKGMKKPQMAVEEYTKRIDDLVDKIRGLISSFRN